jgi:hypothetical protein
MKRKESILVVTVLLAQTALAAGFDPNTDPSLLGYWSFNEGSGTVAADSSGHGNNGQLMNGPIWVPGRIAGALKFDGVDDYVLVPHNAGLLPSGNEVTVSVWINAERHTGPNNATWQGILSKGDAPRLYSLYTEASGVLHFSTGPGGAFVGTLSTGQVPLREWAHIVAMVSGGQHVYYINGQPAGVEGSGATLPAGSTSPLNIGRTPGETDREFLGMIDDVRLYNRALTAEEIKKLIPPKLRAFDPSPADGTTGVTMPLFRWTAGETALFHDVYLGTSRDLTATDLQAVHVPFAMFYFVAGLQPGVTYYWRIDEFEPSGRMYTGTVWSFTAAPITAYAPYPRNGDKWLPTDVKLTWEPGQGATSHEVYFGTDKTAVTNRDAGVSKSIQATPSFAPGALTANTTYYWAVDEIGATGKNAGPLWSFTTIAPGGGVKGEYFNGMTPSGKPALTRTDPSINFSWGDPGGPGAPIGVDGFSARWTADLEIATADTYKFTTTSDDGVRLWLNEKLIIDNWTDHGTTNNSSEPITLEPGIYPLRMEYYENTGGAVAQLSWESTSMGRQIVPAGPLQPPVRARAIYPASGDANVPQDLTLTWSAGQKAAKHAVYFGQDKDAVANATTATTGIYSGLQPLDKASFSPGELDWNQTYYWRVDEVNDASPESPWKGSVWSFTTAGFIIVDDMESYTDDEGNRIYEVWGDGWTNGTGSVVGNLQAPFAEQTIIHGGRQSMPMDYNNTRTPFYSEAETAWAAPQNWTVNGVNTLSLFWRGRTTNGAGKLYVAIEDSTGKVAVAADSAALTATAWTEWKIPLSSVTGVNLAKVKKLYIGVGDRKNPVPGGSGRLYLDDIRVIK